MSDPEELPGWLTFEGLPDDIKWPPLRTSSGGRVPTDWERMNYLAFERALDDSDYRYLYEMAFGAPVTLSSDRFGIADDLRMKDLPLPDGDGETD